jgi:lipoprotein-releasing system permease protein
MIGPLATLQPIELREGDAEAGASLAERISMFVGLYWRATLVVALSVSVVIGVILLFRRFGPGGVRGALGAFAVNSLLGLIAYGGWALVLPVAHGSYFVLWHQLVRVTAAFCGTGLVFFLTLLLIPWALNGFENRGFVAHIAGRHVRAHKSGFLTVISFLSIAGVLLSSLALCVVVSIMGGFGADLKRKILGNNAHVKIEARNVGGFDYWQSVLDEVRIVKGVRAATPVVSGEAMASSSSNTAGVIVRGVDPVTIPTVIDLLSNIEVGKFEYLADPIKLARLPADAPICIGPGGEVYLKGPDFRPFVSDKLDKELDEALVPGDAYPGVVLGRELAKTLHVCVGDEVTLVSPLGDLGPMGVMPRSRRFRVAAIFYSGMYEYDASHAYMNLDVAQSFLDLKHNITGVELKLHDAEAASEVRHGVERAVLDRTDLKVKDWKELNKNLFSALQLEKIATFIVLSIAITVASFCIICTLLLMVTEKSKEIAILKAIGASDRAILGIFMTEGVMIGGIGTVLGVITGLALMLGLQWFGVRLDPDVYYVDRLPINVDPFEYVMVAVSALLISTLATIYPAVAASRLRPVDGIRYE